MKAPVLRHHPLVSLGDGNAQDGTLVLALILARLDQGRCQELCLLRRLDVGEV
jgi:hypothetical protein